MMRRLPVAMFARPMQSISSNNYGTHTLYSPPHDRYAWFAMPTMFGALAAEVWSLLPIRSHNSGGPRDGMFASQALSTSSIFIPGFLTILCLQHPLKVLGTGLTFTISGAFLKTLRHKIIRRFDTNLCLFNPIFNPIICNNPPTFCKFVSGHIIFDISFHLPPQRAVAHDGEEPHAAAARHRRRLCCTPLLPAGCTPPPHAIPCCRRRGCLR